MFENIDGAWIILGSIIFIALIIKCNKRHPEDPGNPMFELDATDENDISDVVERRLDTKRKEEQRKIDEIMKEISNRPDLVMYRFSMRIFKKSFDYVWHPDVIRDNLESFTRQGYAIEDWVALQESQRTDCRMFSYDRYPQVSDTHDEKGLSFLIGDLWVVRDVRQIDPDRVYIFMGIELGAAVWKAEPLALKGKTYKSTYFKRKYKNV